MDNNFYWTTFIKTKPILYAYIILTYILNIYLKAIKILKTLDHSSSKLGNSSFKFP